MERVIIGIAGGSGSGKTTLAKGIKEALRDQAVIIAHDYY
jgi:uridine kinase